MIQVVVDTDVASFGYRNDPLYESYASLLASSDAIISFATYAEMMVGAEMKRWGPRRFDELREYLLYHFAVYDCPIQVCDIWVRLNGEARDKGRHLDYYDGWIAATAMFLNIPLVSNNRKDFDFFDGLKLISFAPT